MRPDPHLQVPPGSRIVELDGLRGVAVLMVIAWHYVGATIDPSLGVWAKAIARTLVLGRTGVDLFFVLSGFLITGIVIDRRKPARQFLAVFFTRRSLRILPPYLLLVTAFWVLVWLGPQTAAFNGEIPWWRHLTFTQNFWMADHGRWGPDAISVTWSVAIEEHFYLVVPILLLSLPRRWIPLPLLLIAAVSIAARMLVEINATTRFAPYVATQYRLDGLALGGVLAWLWRDPTWIARISAHRRVLLASLLAASVAIPALAWIIARDMPWHMFRWGHTFLTLYFTGTLALVLLWSGTSWTAVLRTALPRFAGRISYAAYLFHPFMLSCGYLLIDRTEHIRDSLDALVVVIALFATTILCTASYRLIEQPLIRLGHRLAY